MHVAIRRHWRGLPHIHDLRLPLEAKCAALPRVDSELRLGEIDRLSLRHLRPKYLRVPRLKRHAHRLALDLDAQLLSLVEHKHLLLRIGLHSCPRHPRLPIILGGLGAPCNCLHELGCEVAARLLRYILPLDSCFWCLLWALSSTLRRRLHFHRICIRGLELDLLGLPLPVALVSKRPLPACLLILGVGRVVRSGCSCCLCWCCCGLC
mmetsp:Transcript_11407/g.27972  ORF Transcript_11407/g.27972 Transcript_11407/m.27972 type:complete len:208 (-) Transcript_11407:1394-2017(-)